MIESQYSQLSFIQRPFSPLDTDPTAVSRGKQLPVNMDWEWLGRQCQGNRIRVFNQVLPRGKVTHEYDGLCHGHHVASDHVLFECFGATIRSHGFGWVRYFHIIQSNPHDTIRITDKCSGCGNGKRPLSYVHVPNFDTMSGEWVMSVHELCDNCY